MILSNFPGLAPGWLLRLAGLGCCLLAAACATGGPAPVTAAPPVRQTHLEVVNLTNYEWRITVTSVAGGEASNSRLAPRASLKLDLKGGDYVIEQTVVSGDAGPELARRIPTRLEPGQTYRWRLDTLLSDATAKLDEDSP